MGNKVYIWDCDYMTDGKTHNDLSMRFASYYKQLKWKVDLVVREDEKLFDYNKIIIIKENIFSKLPPTKILEDVKSESYGAAMSLFFNYKTPEKIIFSVRPDYLLYRDSTSSLTKDQKTQYLQLTYEDKEIKKRQNFINTFKGEKAIEITDENFWDFEDKKILKLLNSLKKYDNLSFKNGIKISKIIHNQEIKEIFMKLRFNVGRTNYFINDCGEDDIYEVLSFLKEFKMYKSFKRLKINAVTKYHYNKKMAKQDLIRDLKIINYCKENEIRIDLIKPLSPNPRFSSYFNRLCDWNNNHYRISFIEYMLQDDFKKYGLDIIDDKTLWHSLAAKQMLYLIWNYYDDIAPYLYIQWGKDRFVRKIRLEYIRGY